MSSKSLALGAIGILSMVTIATLFSAGMFQFQLPSRGDEDSTRIQKLPGSKGFVIDIPIMVEDEATFQSSGNFPSGIVARTSHDIRSLVATKTIPKPERVNSATYGKLVGGQYTHDSHGLDIYLHNGKRVKSTTTTATQPVMTMDGQKLGNGGDTPKIWITGETFDSNTPTLPIILGIEVIHQGLSGRELESHRFTIPLRVPYEERHSYTSSAKTILHMYIPFGRLPKENILVNVQQYKVGGYVDWKTLTRKIEYTWTGPFLNVINGLFGTDFHTFTYTKTIQQEVAVPHFNERPSIFDRIPWRYEVR